MIDKEFAVWLSNRVDEKTFKNYVSILDDLNLDIGATPKEKLGKELTNFIGKKWTRLFAVKNLLLYHNRTDVFPYLPSPKNLRRPRKHKRKSIPFSKIKEACRFAGKELKAIIMLQYETGARIGEILEARIEDFNKNNITIGGLKGSESRTIHLTENTIKELEEVISSRKSGLIFNMKYQTVLNQMKKAFRNAGVDVSTHWLRTSRAVHLFEAGHSPLEIKVLLGHRNLESTYAYLKEAGLNLQDLINKNRPNW